MIRAVRENGVGWGHRLLFSTPGWTRGLIFEATLSPVPIALLLPHLPNKILTLDFLFMLLKKERMRRAPVQVHGLYLHRALLIPPISLFFLISG